MCSPVSEPKRIRVVANLPYYITKDVLRQMLPMSDRISHLHFMLQVRLATLARPKPGQQSRPQGGTHHATGTGRPFTPPRIGGCGECSQACTASGAL